MRSCAEIFHFCRHEPLAPGIMTTGASSNHCPMTHSILASKDSLGGQAWTERIEITSPPLVCQVLAVARIRHLKKNPFHPHSEAAVLAGMGSYGARPRSGWAPRHIRWWSRSGGQFLGVNGWGTDKRNGWSDLGERGQSDW